MKTISKHPVAYRGLAKWMMIVGLATIVMTFWGTVHFVAPFYTHTYPFAWYGLILLLDGLLCWRWSDGILCRRPFEFATLLFWSAVFWFFFEIWNLRLQNWYYVGVAPRGLWTHLEAYFDFATVLPGMFLVYRLLHCLRIPGQVTTRFALSKALHPHSIVVGIIVGMAMLVLPLLYPDWFFPLVWGALIFLLDPICAKYGGPSLLRDAKNREWTALVRLLLAGMLCGGYWEFCNYWSMEKWIYTVPFFSEGKLFEMPYLGFLGFPPFCVQCFVMTNAVFLVRGGRHWNPDVSQGLPTRSTCRLAYLVMIALALFLSEFAYSKMEQHTVDSRSEPLQKILKDISPPDAYRLREQGWYYPRQILSHWEEASQIISTPLREPIRQRIELAGHLHMGSTNARLLEKAGVGSLEALGHQDPDQLFGRLLAINRIVQLRDSPLVKRRVAAWIRGAQRKSALY